MNPREKREKEEIKELKKLHKSVNVELTEEYIKKNIRKEYERLDVSINYYSLTDVITRLNELKEKYGNVTLYLGTQYDCEYAYIYEPEKTLKMKILNTKIDNDIIEVETNIGTYEFSLVDFSVSLWRFTCGSDKDSNWTRWQSSYGKMEIEDRDSCGPLPYVEPSEEVINTVLKIIRDKIYYKKPR